MKITNISVWGLKLPLHKPYYLSGGRLRFECLDSTFVRIDTDAGLQGWGEGCREGCREGTLSLEGEGWGEGVLPGPPRASTAGERHMFSLREEAAVRGNDDDPVRISPCPAAQFQPPRPARERAGVRVLARHRRIRGRCRVPPRVDRCVHTPAFREDERRFPRYKEAVTFERRFLDRLLKY